MGAQGGWMLAASLFRLRRSETAMVGFGIGLVLQTWLANLLAHGMPILIAFWLSAALVLLAGGVSALVFRRNLRFDFSLSQWLWLGILTLLFNAIGRGLGIFDDYQNLPTISLMAAGDVPPHFALNPALNFGYHYFLLLFAAQFMRIGNMFPWSALDLARGLILALPLILAGLWAYRLTRNTAGRYPDRFHAGFCRRSALAFAFAPASLAQSHLRQHHVDRFCGRHGLQSFRGAAHQLEDRRGGADPLSVCVLYRASTSLMSWLIPAYPVQPSWSCCSFC